MLEPIRHILEKKIIIFASGSKSRQEVVKQMDLDKIIEFKKSTFEENLDPKSFSTFDDFVVETALQKVLEVEQRLEKKADVVMAADTIVLVDNILYQKPKTDEEARTMLKSLSGRSNVVLTGMVIKLNGKDPITFTEKAVVNFGDMTDEQIEAYIKTKDPFNYAGAYAIQGRPGTLIKNIEGNYYSILGIPIYKMCEILYDLYREK